MRWSAVVFLLVVAACAPEQRPGPATTTVSSPTIATPATDTTSEPATSGTTKTLTALQSIAFEEIARLPFPVQLTAHPGSDEAYIATKDGRVWRYDEAGIAGDPILDLRDRVRNRGEQGLLSIVLHSDDPTRLFAHYSANDGDTVLSELSLPDGGERVLLRLDQPAGNHNGGMIQFGPDGLLYLGLGDGGGSSDRFDNGQNRDTLLGGLVQVDVDSGQSLLFQYGLRNPWRFWIEDDLIYIADVGQSAFEEISVAPLEADVNYGWPITEGLHCFRPASGCDTDGLTLPVVEVAHGDAGTCSITGGIVYRGRAIPELDGTYFFSDYCGGYLRGLRDGEVIDFTDQVGVPGRVVGFGVDGSGEMYVATRERLLKVVPVRG